MQNYKPQEHFYDLTNGEESELYSSLDCVYSVASKDCQEESCLRCCYVCNKAGFDVGAENNKAYFKAIYSLDRLMEKKLAKKGIISREFRIKLNNDNKELIISRALVIIKTLHKIYGGKFYIHVEKPYGKYLDKNLKVCKKTFGLFVEESNKAEEDYFLIDGDEELMYFIGKKVKKEIFPIFQEELPIKRILECKD